MAEFEAFLELCLCKFIKNDQGHAKYTRSDLFRPIIFQNHISPVPEFIIRNALRPLGLSKKDFFIILSQKKKMIKTGDGSYQMID